MGWWLSLRLNGAQPLSLYTLPRKLLGKPVLQSMLALYLWIICSYFWAILRRLSFLIFFFWCACWGPDSGHHFAHAGNRALFYTSNIFCLTYFRWVWGSREKAYKSKEPVEVYQAIRVAITVHCGCTLRPVSRQGVGPWMEHQNLREGKDRALREVHLEWLCIKGLWWPGWRWAGCSASVRG